MQTRKSTNTLLYSFDSLRELGTFIRDTKRTWGSVNQSKDVAPDKSWDLGLGFDGAVAMAREGWLEGAQRAQRALEAFAPVKVEPDTRTDVYGYRPHVARFCAGAPDSMIRHTYEHPDGGGGKVITLVVSVAANAYVRAESMSNFGIAIAQYVNQLETQGTRVELIGCSVSQLPSRLAFSWIIKRADQPLDLAVVAFSIGHPAMLRRLEFALCERSGAPVNPGYGVAARAKTSDIINAPDGAIILNGMEQADLHAPTPEAGLAYVERTIQQAIKEQVL